MSSQNNTDPILDLTRAFDAPPARVFAAWLERDHWQAWIGPEHVPCEVLQHDARVGGRYRLTMHPPDGQPMTISGEFKVIEPPRRLVMTWGLDGDTARQSLITLTFRAIGDKTELRLRQEGLRSVESVEGHRKGWESALNKLAAYVRRIPS